MDAKSAEIGETLERRAEELTQTLSTVARDINATLTGRVEEVSRSLGVSVDQFKDQVVAPMQDLSRRFDTSRAELEDKVGDHAERVTGMLDLHKASMDAAFYLHRAVVVDATRQSAQVFDARLAALSEAADQRARIIDSRLADLVEAANRNAESIDERLAGRIQAMCEPWRERPRTPISTWAARGASVAGAIRARVDDLREVIEGKGADLVAALGERGEDVLARIAGVGERAIQTLDQQMASLAALLTRRTDELIAAVNGSASDPVRARSALTGQLRSEVANSSETLRNVAAEATHRSAETIDGLLRQLTEQVEASTRVGDAVARSAENSVGALSARATGAQRIDAGDRQSRRDQHRDRSGDRIGRRPACRRPERARGAGRRIPACARRHRFAGRDARPDFRDHPVRRRRGRRADRPARGDPGRGGTDLTQQQRSLDFALEHRQSSLQALIGDLSGRSEAFEATLGRFAANVEDSFARAQARAEEISATLASATRGASIAVAGQFETIRDTAAKERERTAQRCKRPSNRPTPSSPAPLRRRRPFPPIGGRGERDGEPGSRELDETRQELRRGVLDLPQETSETAEAMRRVVSDQIRALKELAALVADLGAPFDVAEPAPLAAATAVGAGVASTSRSRAPRDDRAQPRAAHAARDHAGAGRRSDPFPVVENPAQGLIGEVSPPLGRTPAQPWLRRTARGGTAPPPSASDRGQAGWLSSLLAGRFPRRAGGRRAQAAETLDALALEISGLIDNAAAVEMWDRWRRGDPAAVSRRLYTEAGQQAFDESAPLSRRPAVPRYDDAIYAGVRASVGEGQPERPRRLAMAGLSPVQHRQGLYDPRPRVAEGWLRAFPLASERGEGRGEGRAQPLYPALRATFSPRVGEIGAGAPASGRRSDDLVRGEGAGAGGVDLDLRRRMVDAELIGQVARQPMQETVAGMAPGHDQMARQGNFRRAHRPDVQIMHSVHAGLTGKERPHRRGIDARKAPPPSPCQAHRARDPRSPRRSRR